MPTSYSPQYRLAEQATGENLNTWGVILNAAIAMIEELIGGNPPTITLTGATTLTSLNNASDQSRPRILILNGTPGAGTVVTDAASIGFKLVKNATSATVVLKPGSGSGATLPVGWNLVFCDGSTYSRIILSDFNSTELTNLASGLSASSAVTVAQLSAAITAAAVPAASGAVLNSVLDTTSDFLAAKVLGSTPITVTTQNPGGNENLLVAHSTSGVVPGTYGTGSSGPIITVDANGHITSASVPKSAIIWQSTPITANGTTIIAGNGYLIDTTSAGFTITAPATANVSDKFALVDISGKWATNNLTIAANGLKYPTVGGSGAIADFICDRANAAVTFLYSGATQGWVLI